MRRKIQKILAGKGKILIFTHILNYAQNSTFQVAKVKKSTEINSVNFFCLGLKGAE